MSAPSHNRTYSAAPEVQNRRYENPLEAYIKFVSQGPRAPVRLGFPLDVVERWFPRLYPVDWRLPNQAFAAATASISISHSGTTSALTMIVAEPGRASPKCFARAAPAGARSSGRTR